MLKILECRRTFTAVTAIAALTALGWVKDMDVAMAITTCVGAVAGSNAAEKVFRKNK